MSMFQKLVGKISQSLGIILTCTVIILVFVQIVRVILT